MMLKNKVVLVTGSSRGIGAATARLAKSYGARVVLHGRTDSKLLRDMADSIDAFYVYCDVADERAVYKEIGKVIDKEDRVDVLVNCAGITRPRNFLEVTDEEWIEVFKVNVIGVSHFCKAVIPHMQKGGGGRIVNVASIRGHSETPGRATYSVSKAAVINLTAVLAKEFAPEIAVNAVSPAFTKTDFSKHWNEATWNQTKKTLIGRAAEPEEIAEVILFLGSERAKFITGQTIIVDGGYTMAEK